MKIQNTATQMVPDFDHSTQLTSLGLGETSFGWVPVLAHLISLESILEFRSVSGSMFYPAFLVFNFQK